MISLVKRRSLKYQPLRNQPVLRCYYQGDHSHPVRRTLVIIEITSDHVTGYELRAGSETRPLHKAPIRTYRRDRIAKIEQCGRRLRKRTPKKHHSNSTFTRAGWMDLALNGP